MKSTHHILINSLLILSMLILPLQNAWSMASMASCELASSSHKGVSEQSMDMQNCDHHMDQLDVSDNQTQHSSDQDCSETQCNSCSQFSFYLSSELAIRHHEQSQSIILYRDVFFGSHILPDLPPPIIS